MNAQYKITLQCGEVIRSEAFDTDAEDSVQCLELLEIAAKDGLNYMKFKRDTGDMIVISKESLRTAKYFEFVKVE